MNCCIFSVVGDTWIRSARKVQWRRKSKARSKSSNNGSNNSGTCDQNTKECQHSTMQTCGFTLLFKSSCFQKLSQRRLESHGATKRIYLCFRNLPPKNDVEIKSYRRQGIYLSVLHACMVRSVVFLRRDRCSSEAEHQDPDLFFVYRQNLAGRPLIGH